ncbi:MAG: DUF2071 domain-containing protein [Planctomycetaceae bacterium]|nr:DUF2071 domain-containing protein [Planctomycetaceae bacterium]
MTESLPSGSIAGYQTWRKLTFLHWRVSQDDVQQLLPDGLEAETFDGSAWVGLVPFSMERVRPWWSPAVPGISWFLETNVRTYVRHRDGTSAVWFFSLDANHRLAVRIARWFWYLPYIDCRMSLTEKDGIVRYTGQRSETSAGGYTVRIRLPEELRLIEAEPETLEYFLLERYTLLSRRPNGQYFSGRVFHDPYSWVSLTGPEVSESLLGDAGLSGVDGRPPDHAAYSPGVDVRIGRLTKLP